MKVILAGNEREFKTWLWETRTNQKEAYYAASESSLRGMRFTKVIVVGTFWKNKNSHRIFEYANACVKAWKDESMTTKKPAKRWMPEKGDRYYEIRFEGLLRVVVNSEVRDGWQNDNEFTTNCFRTKREAQAIAAKVRLLFKEGL
jgi:hypothetical protein